MPLTYTTIDAIALRLKGRLRVGGSPVAFGSTVADPALIEQVGTQVESRVNAQLRQIYKLPLRKTQHPELASIAEKLTIAELVPVYYYGQEPSLDGSFGRLMKDQGEKELTDLGSGDVILEGEIFAQSPHSVVPNYTQAGRRATRGASVPVYSLRYPTRNDYANGWSAWTCPNRADAAEQVGW